MKEYDVVSLKNSRHGLPAGLEGTIVHENEAGKCFIVEFMDDEGQTTAIADLSFEDLELVREFKS